MDQVPAAIKAADVNLWRCAIKGAQLHSVKPIMAYWCYYWVVNQILGRQLHTADDGVMAYTTRLMDALEKIKGDLVGEEAITDDVAGQAYVENFSQETLDRAERVIKANRVTQQTATTFEAAATFFQLVNIWGPADAETQQKIKYAKWNAARIAKAIKEGRDPNESNPRPELLPDEEGSPPRAVTVEEVPDADTPTVTLPDTPAHLQLPGVPGPVNQSTRPGYFDAADSLPSPLSPPGDELAHQTVPSVTNWAPTPEPPAAPAFSPPPTFAPPPTLAPDLQSTGAMAPPPLLNFASMASPTNNSKPAMPGPSPVYDPTVPAGMDEATMVQAQKHAKWAISALNFEDVPTAVRELRKALETLGAS